MSFGENLRMIRKEKGLSQEDLAELLEVSRQAISKWEMDMGYPEVEKLLILANTLHVSLDDLMFSKKENIQEKKMITGSIVIKSPHQGTITTCNKVVRSNQMIGNKNSPKYALFAVDSNHVSFWGEA
ncbi:MAG: helix-turn-helix transcriptional regulator, partial [Erysipelotrichales bacterium]|nr:helix-turn-helix transcriptional regulator [Erysipelotrichales bacterium]